MRRYNDFYAFRKALVLKWPGIYIPGMPPKKPIVSYAITIGFCSRV